MVMELSPVCLLFKSNTPILLFVSGLGWGIYFIHLLHAC